MSETVLRQIDQMWQDELFAPPEEDDYPDPVGGQRVTHFQAYMNLVDWRSTEQVNRALRVFEVALRSVFQPAWGDIDPVTIQRLQRLFARDGLSLSDKGLITPVQPNAVAISPALLSNLDDPHVIQEHLDRIAAAVGNGDARQMIGSAKELIESTAKVVLRTTHTDFAERDDVPALVSRAQEALGLSPKSDRGLSGPDGSNPVKKTLGSAVTIANSIAELRNLGYGTGHGSSERRVGLHDRHARLALNGARLWCEFMLDTLADPNAPWRETQPPS